MKGYIEFVEYVGNSAMTDVRFIFSVVFSLCFFSFDIGDETIWSEAYAAFLITCTLALFGWWLGLLDASAALLVEAEKHHAAAIKSFKIVLGTSLISLLLYVIVKYTCCVLATMFLFGGAGGSTRHEGAGSFGAAG